MGTEGILGIVSITTFLVLSIFNYKLGMGFGALVCLCAATISLVVLLRTKNWYFIPMFTGQLTAIILMSMAAFFDVKEMLELVLPFVVIMAASFTVMFVFTFQRKLKWRTREMLELAAQPVVSHLGLSRIENHEHPAAVAAALSCFRRHGQHGNGVGRCSPVDQRIS